MEKEFKKGYRKGYLDGYFDAKRAEEISEQGKHKLEFILFKDKVAQLYSLELRIGSRTLRKIDEEEEQAKSEEQE